MTDVYAGPGTGGLCIWSDTNMWFADSAKTSPYLPAGVPGVPQNNDTVYINNMTVILDVSTNLLTALYSGIAASNIGIGQIYCNTNGVDNLTISATTITGGSTIFITNSGINNLNINAGEGGTISSGSSPGGYVLYNQTTGTINITGNLVGNAANTTVVNGTNGTVNLNGNIVCTTGNGILTTGVVRVVGDVSGGSASSINGISAYSAYSIVFVRGTVNAGTVPAAHGINSKGVVGVHGTINGSTEAVAAYGVFGTTSTLYYNGSTDNKLSLAISGVTPVANAIIQKQVGNWNTATDWCTGAVPLKDQVVCLTNTMVMDGTHIPASAATEGNETDALTSLVGFGGLTVNLNALGDRRINAVNFLGNGLVVSSGSTYSLDIYGNIQGFISKNTQTACIMNSSTGVEPVAINIYGNITGSVDSGLSVLNTSTGTINIYGSIIGGSVASVGGCWGVSNTSSGTIRVYDHNVKAGTGYWTNFGISNSSTGNIYITDGNAEGGDGITTTCGIMNSGGGGVYIIRGTAKGGTAFGRGITNSSSGSISIDNGSSGINTVTGGALTGSCGIENTGSGPITITGNITPSGNVTAISNASGQVTITGNLVATAASVITNVSGPIIIFGNVTGAISPCIISSSGNVTITGTSTAAIVSAGSVALTPAVKSLSTSVLTLNNANIINTTNSHAIAMVTLPIFVIGSENYIQYGAIKFPLQLPAHQVEAGVRHGDTIGAFTLCPRRVYNDISNSVSGVFV